MKTILQIAAAGEFGGSQLIEVCDGIGKQIRVLVEDLVVPKV